MATAENGGATSLQEELGLDLLMNEEDFKNKRLTSCGDFTVLYSATHVKSGERVALKVCQTSDETFGTASEMKKIAERDSRNRECIIREIQILRKCQHKNIIRLIGWYEHDSDITAVQELAKWVLFDDYSPAESWTHREWNDGSPIITNAVRVLYEIADGMQYLNSLSPPLLCNLKSQNILILKDGTAKIAEFGFYDESRYRPKAITRDLSLKMNTIAMGTLGSASPEWIGDRKVDPSRRQDVYSYAIIMWEVLTYGRETRPYGTANDDKITKKVLNGERPNCEKLYCTTPDSMKCLIQCCWHADFKQRPRFDDIKKLIKLELDKLQSSGMDEVAAALE